MGQGPVTLCGMGEKRKAAKAVVAAVAVTVAVSGCEKPVTPPGGRPVVCVTPDDPARGSCR